MKRALITGASSGIGKAFAQKLATFGYEITAVSRNTKELANVVDSLPSGQHKPLMADLSTDGGIEKVVAELGHTKYCLLINNAGIGVYGVMEAVAYEKQQAMMRLNIDAVTKLSFAFLKSATKGDALINVSSMVSFTSYPKSPVYAGTKGYERLFSESLWYQEKKRGVYVMTLCPGLTRTNWHKNAGGTDEISYPPFITQSAAECVDEALSALWQRQKPVVIPGWYNRLGAFLFRLFSMERIITLQGRYISDAINAQRN